MVFCSFFLGAMPRMNEMFAKIPFPSLAVLISSNEFWVYPVYLVMSRISMSDTSGRFTIKISKELKVQRKGRILTHFLSTLTVFVYNFDIFIGFAIESNTSWSIILQFIQQMNVIPLPYAQNNVHLCSSLTPVFILHSSFGSCIFFLFILKMKHANSSGMPNVNKSYPMQHLAHKSAFQKEKPIKIKVFSAITANKVLKHWRW